MGTFCGGLSPVRTAGVVFRANIYGGLTSLDPAFARTEANGWLVGRIYDPLLRYDDSLRLVPALAKSHSVSANGMEYVFVLRRDAYFHPHAVFGADSSRRVDARDVVFSFTRVVDPGVASPGQWLFNQCVEGVEAFRTGAAKTVSGFRAADDSTVVVRLTRPFAPFLRLMASPYASVVPREAPTAGVGTGPFRLKAWREGRTLILHKNPRYFAGAPALDAVAFRFIAGKTSAFHEFLRGGLDYLDAPDPALVEELFDPEGRLKAEYAARFDVKVLPQMTTEYVGLLAGDDFPALADVRVRRALSLALDRRRLARLPITAVPTGGFVPEGVPGFAARSAPVYDPDSARKLVRRFGARLFTPACPVDQPRLSFASRTHTKILERNRGANPNRRDGRCGLAAAGGVGGRAGVAGSWVADYPDPRKFFRPFFFAQHSPVRPNYTRFSLPEYDSLYRSAVANPNPQTYARLESLLAEHVPVVVLYYYRTVRLTHKKFIAPGHPMFLELERVRCRE